MVTHLTSDVYFNAFDGIKNIKKQIKYFISMKIVLSLSDYKRLLGFYIGRINKVFYCILYQLPVL